MILLKKYTAYSTPFSRRLLHMWNNTSADHARQSYGSLLDYYFDRPASKESIRIGLKMDEVPSQVQVEELQKELAESLKAH
ncbi:hypothetical protein FQN54_009233 [Arachnomyces sp. PD_36]|nr:hypothetical protein FQN54_009233 [Arachnomyces sp. PD_36]